jgi:CheY-like chemotaxis protein
LQAVVGDSNQLIQVFLNLISNAEHAIREVRESGRIQIRIGRIGAYIAATVQDDGVGILPEALPKLFDPFYTTKRPGGGTGLGLSICTAIVREHGGSIDVETLPVGGSAFTVFLPVASPGDSLEPLADGLTPALPRMRSESADVLKGRAILILDDEESIRMLLEEGLCAHGLHVEFAKGRSYDILLCDLNLSANGYSTGGREAAEQIVAAAGARKPIVIFMTGDLVDTSGDSSKPPRLQKPFRISEVLAMFREVFSASTPAQKR